MMKYLAASVLCLGLTLGGAAYGQGADRPGGPEAGPGGATTGTTTGRFTDTTTNQGFGWGWLGLIGLIGLAGLMPRNDDRHRYTSTTTGTGTRP